MAIGPSGALIALATADETIILYRCDWSAPAQSGSACASAPLGDAHGRAVAISPDEKRIAVGDQAGNGDALRSRRQRRSAIQRASKAPINALGWAGQRDWLAVGTTKGEIAVLDVGAEQMPIVAQQKFGDGSDHRAGVEPGELALAFVCNGKAVCLWRAKPTPTGLGRSSPQIRFEGHSLGITRLSFAPSGARLASGAADGTIRIWSLTQDTDASYALYAETPGKSARSRCHRTTNGSRAAAPMARLGSGMQGLAPPAELSGLPKISRSKTLPGTMKGAVAALRGQ